MIFFSHAWFLYSNIVFLILTLPSSIKLSNVFDFEAPLFYFSNAIGYNFSIFHLLKFDMFDFNNYNFLMNDFISDNNLYYNITDNNVSSKFNNIISFSESSSTQRFTRFNNSLINYDYKTGNYIGNWDKQYPFLVTSLIEVARGIRKPS